MNIKHLIIIVLLLSLTSCNDEIIPHEENKNKSDKPLDKKDAKNILETTTMTSSPIPPNIDSSKNIKKNYYHNIIKNHCNNKYFYHNNEIPFYNNINLINGKIEKYNYYESKKYLNKKVKELNNKINIMEKDRTKYYKEYVELLTNQKKVSEITQNIRGVLINMDNNDPKYKIARNDLINQEKYEIDRLKFVQSRGFYLWDLSELIQNAIKDLNNSKKEQEKLSKVKY